MKYYLVVYQVRYGPRDSGASWMEESAVIEAKSPRAAQRKFRQRAYSRPNGRGTYEVGRHVSTTVARPQRLRP